MTIRPRCRGPVLLLEELGESLKAAVPELLTFGQALRRH
jgi:hypothetical protein